MSMVGAVQAIERVYIGVYSQGLVQVEVMEHVSKEGKRVLSDYQARYPKGPPGILLKVRNRVEWNKVR